jgi:hypothetical protein
MSSVSSFFYSSQWHLTCSSSTKMFSPNYKCCYISTWICYTSNRVFTQNELSEDI